MTEQNTPEEWTAEQRRLFTKVHQFASTNRDMLVHPMADPISEEHWATVAFNFAWMAAEALDYTDDTAMEIVDDQQRIVNNPPPTLQ